MHTGISGWTGIFIRLDPIISHLEAELSSNLRYSLKYQSSLDPRLILAMHTGISGWTGIFIRLDPIISHLEAELSSNLRYSLKYQSSLDPRLILGLHTSILRNYGQD